MEERILFPAITYKRNQGRKITDAMTKATAERLVTA